MKELNFNKADIDSENENFYQWQEEMKPEQYKTWYAYFLKGGNSTYVGLISGKLEYKFKFENMDFKEARRHLKFNHLRTNLDDCLTAFDKKMFADCRVLAENRWYKDCGLGYRVKELGR